MLNIIGKTIEFTQDKIGEYEVLYIHYGIVRMYNIKTGIETEVEKTELEKMIKNNSVILKNQFNTVQHN